MKISVGTDIIEIDRIKEAVSNTKFINRIYTTKEISYCEETRNMKFQHYGARFAGKEATFKAISAFLTTPEKFNWKNIEITNKEDGKPDKAVIINSHAEAYGLSEDTANVNAEAKGSIYLAEKEGDMRVGSIISHEGDVNLEAKDGRLIDALPKQSNTNNVDENDLIHHWIDAGLIAGTADYEGAYIKGLKQDAANYAARVEEQFNEFKSGGREISLRQKFTKPGSAETYGSAAEYLAQDKNYMVMENSSAGYKANIEYEFAHKEGNPDLEAKYANYGSAEAYLAQDTAYQNMLTSSKNYKDKTEQEFALFSAEESVRQKFTRTDGTYYISASEYLANDATYQQLVKDTQAKTNPYVRQINQEFTDYKNGTASEAVAAKYADYDSVSQFLLADIRQPESSNPWA